MSYWGRNSHGRKPGTAEHQHQKIQNNLPEHLLLLDELGYSDLDMPYQYFGTHSNEITRDVDTNREIRLLDAIAVALTTRNPGDIFAATFDKREHMELVLAKNGPPSPEGVDAADELVLLIGSPTIKDALDLFPFLMRRCGANIDKRIRNLHTSIQSRELRSDFTPGLQDYVPKTIIRDEFSGANEHLLGKYGDRSFPET